MVLVGRITVIHNRPGTELAYGRVQDTKDGRIYPFQAPAGIYNVGDKVSFEPEGYDSYSYNLVKGKERVLLREKL